MLVPVSTQSTPDLSADVASDQNTMLGPGHARACQCLVERSHQQVQHAIGKLNYQTHKREPTSHKAKTDLLRSPRALRPQS